MWEQNNLKQNQKYGMMITVWLSHNSTQCRLSRGTTCNITLIHVISVGHSHFSKNVMSCTVSSTLHKLSATCSWGICNSVEFWDALLSKAVKSSEWAGPEKQLSDVLEKCRFKIMRLMFIAVSLYQLLKLHFWVGNFLTNRQIILCKLEVIL